MKISIKEKARLERIAKQNDVKGGYATLAVMFNREVKKLEEKGITTNIERFAVNAVLNHFRRKKQKPFKSRGGAAAPIYGFLIGDNGLVDKMQIIRNVTKKYINVHGLQAAQDNQMVNGDNQILDTRKTVFGRENPDYLEVLPPNKKVLDRLIFGFFRKNGSKAYKFSSLQTSDNKLAKAWGKAKMFTPCQTFANIKEESNTEMVLRSSQAEGTFTVFKAIKEDWDIDKIIQQAIKNKITKIQKVEDHFETFKDTWTRKVILKGVVSWINIDRPNSWGAIWMQLMDPDDEEAVVRVQIPAHLQIDFGELSEVIVFGKTRRSKFRGEGGKLEDGDVVANAFGIWPIPGFSTPSSAGKVEGVDEKEIEGWLE